MEIAPRVSIPQVILWISTYFSTELSTGCGSFSVGVLAVTGGALFLHSVVAMLREEHHKHSPSLSILVMYRGGAENTEFADND